MSANQRVKGQSSIEFLVSMAFLLPIALLLPTLANMLLVQTEAHKAARYAAWERTAYPVDQLKTTNNLSREVEDRFLRRSTERFVNTNSQATVTTWNDFRYNRTMVDFTSQQVVATQFGLPRSATATSQNASAWLAGRGGQNNSNNAVQLGTLQSTRLSIPLRSDTSLLQATRPRDALYFENDPGNAPVVPLDAVAQRNRFYVASSSSLVADGWAAGNETMFRDRVSDVDRKFQNFQNFYQNGLVSRGLALVFGELNEHMFVNSADERESFNMVDSNQSTNLPAYLKE